jgi:hypothetical protein
MEALGFQKLRPLGVIFFTIQVLAAVHLMVQTPLFLPLEILFQLCDNKTNLEFSTRHTAFLENSSH